MDGAGVTTGLAYLFEHSGGIWTEVQKLTPSDGEAGDYFGWSVAIDGNRVLSGAEGVAAGTYEKAGAAYVWRVNDDGWLQAFGTGTPGCNGTQTMWATRPPELGLGGMALTCDNAPPSSVGTLIVGDAADAGGADLVGLGVLLHVDLLASNFLILTPMFSDAGGNALTPTFTVPSNPNFAGLELQVQSLWIWASCALPPNGLSTSRGLTVRLLAP